MIPFSEVRVGQDWSSVATICGNRLLGLPVRLHGIQLGRPVDLLLDREELRVLGLDVLCGDDVHRFLALPTASLAEDSILIKSPLVLLEEDELDFYRTRALALSSLRGRPIEQRGREVGPLDDIVIGSDGFVRQLIVARDGGELLDFDETVRIADASRSAA